MATHPIIPESLLDQELDTTEPRLTRKEGWALINSMFGSAKEMYAEVGGAEAFMRAERAAWTEDDCR